MCTARWTGGSNGRLKRFLYLPKAVRARRLGRTPLPTLGSQTAPVAGVDSGSSSMSRAVSAGRVDLRWRRTANRTVGMRSSVVRLPSACGKHHCRGKTVPGVLSLPATPKLRYPLCLKRRQLTTHVRELVLRTTSECAAVRPLATPERPRGHLVQPRALAASLATGRPP